MAKQYRNRLGTTDDGKGQLDDLTGHSLTMQFHFKDSASELTLARSGQGNWSIAVKGHLLDLFNQSIECFIPSRHPTLKKRNAFVSFKLKPDRQSVVT